MEQEFERVVSDWAQVRERSRSDISRWEQKVNQLALDEGRLRDSGLWVHGRTDYLGVIGLHRDELVHSRLVGWLLDPCGHHGLGPRVLKAVLTHAGLRCEGTVRPERARVALEVVVQEGRMDIVVQGPGFYLVIENKVDAEEGLDLLSTRECRNR